MRQKGRAGRAVALLAAFAAAVCVAAPPTAKVTVDPTQELRAIKPMNGVNNGPSGSRGIAGARQLYALAKIPFARTHDSNFHAGYGGPHTVDITAVFPNFDADENDPASYDFPMTDRYLTTITNAGTEVFFCLGQSIEHGIKKYGIYPPKDFAKWARITCHLTDPCRVYTEFPLEIKDGCVTVPLERNAFALVEFE